MWPVVKQPVLSFILLISLFNFFTSHLPAKVISRATLLMNWRFFPHNIDIVLEGLGFGRAINLPLSGISNGAAGQVWTDHLSISVKYHLFWLRDIVSFSSWYITFVCTGSLVWTTSSYINFQLTWGHFNSHGMFAITSTASAPPTPIHRPPRPPETRQGGQYNTGNVLSLRTIINNSVTFIPTIHILKRWG